MFIDLRTCPAKAEFDADIAIVGAGPAGISVAKEFLGTNVRVCLVESGDFDLEPEIQDLNGGEVVGLPYFALTQARFRRFGGSVNGWMGSRYAKEHADTNIAPLNGMDFERRPWVPESGWPFGLDHLVPYYARAQGLFNAGPWEYVPDAWQAGNRRFLPTDPERLVTRVWQYAPGTRFGVAYRDPFRHADNITVLTNATVTEVSVDETASVARNLEVSTLDGKRGQVRARLFVLACGGIDNARLLLLSDSIAPQGLGNRNGLVGRYFMEHPHLACASVRLTGDRGWLAGYKDFTARRTRIRAGLCIADAAQERFGVLNQSAIVIDRFVADSASGAESPGYVALKAMAARLSCGELPNRPVEQLARVLGDVRSTMEGVRRHRAGLNGALYVRAEQAPNPDSRVTLSDRRDRLGLRRARLDWRLTELDKRSIRTLVDLTGQEFRRLGLGEVTPEEWLVAEDNSWPAWLRGGYHHMGTTRMSTDFRKGVVDPDGRIHGMANLYVAGSSVFPAGGYANPTLTVVALALRLADHVRERLAHMQEPASIGEVGARSLASSSAGRNP